MWVLPGIYSCDLLELVGDPILMSFTVQTLPGFGDPARGLHRSVTVVAFRQRRSSAWFTRHSTTTSRPRSSDGVVRIELGITVDEAGDRVEMGPDHVDEHGVVELPGLGLRIAPRVSQRSQVARPRRHVVGEVGVVAGVAPSDDTLLSESGAGRRASGAVDRRRTRRTTEKRAVPARATCPAKTSPHRL